MNSQSTHSLPIPSAEAQAQSNTLIQQIRDAITQASGWLSFAQFMQMALYTPHLGYYSGGAKKFGSGGDFVTAPEISPLFGAAVAKQVKQVLAETNGDVLELGAGTGKLAKDVLLALAKTEQLPNHYFILEVSDHLRQVQQETLKSGLPKEVFERVQWLNALPESFTGFVLGNEVLDAIPVHLITKQSGALLERGVAIDADAPTGFVWQDKPLSDAALVEEVSTYNLPDDYLTEVNPAGAGLVSSLSAMLERGAIVLLDYGFGFNEYYHAQRNQGTLMCHYQQYAHDDPLVYVGLQDITAHVNFTAMAEAGFAQGLDVAYVNQASFLMNCGLLDLLEQQSPENLATYAPHVSAVQKLVSPAEMGELFKVLSLSKGMHQPMLGFVAGDKRHSL